VSETFHDHFSGHADAYAASRPGDYPQELIHFLADAAPSRTLAWDAATGNGQAARLLAERFEQVIATDASGEQIANAPPHPQIQFRTTLSEASGIEQGTVALTTVAQSFHWFDFNRFFDEVRRVSAPQALVAVWCYDLARITPAVDALTDHLARDIVGPFWPPERKWVDERYQTIPFPFEEIEVPRFEMTARWSLERYLAYIQTWSAVKRFSKHHQSDPIDPYRSAFVQAWGGDQHEREIHWPIAVRLGRVG
jgi:SAM-dependent methyltransferase